MELLAVLEAMVDPSIRGHPESPLRWTCKITAILAEELQEQQRPVSDWTGAGLLKAAGYTLQANRKSRQRPRMRIAERSHGDSGSATRSASLRQSIDAARLRLQSAPRPGG